MEWVFLFQFRSTEFGFETVDSIVRDAAYFAGFNSVLRNLVLRPSTDLLD